MNNINVNNNENSSSSYAYVRYLKKIIDGEYENKNTIDLNPIYIKTEDSLFNLEEFVKDQDMLGNCGNNKKTIVDKTSNRIQSILQYISSRYPEHYSEFDSIIIDRLNLVDNNLYYEGDFSEIQFAAMKIFLDFTEDSDKAIEYFKAVLGNEPDEAIEFYALSTLLESKYNSDNQKYLSFMSTSIREAFENGNRDEALDNMRKLAILVCYYNLNITGDEFTSYYNGRTCTIYINEIYSNAQAALHELGHAIDQYFYPFRSQEEVEDILALAKSRITSNPSAKSFIFDLRRRIFEISEQAGEEYDQQVIDAYGSRENLLHELEEYAEGMIEEGRLDEMLKSFNLPRILQERIKFELGDDVRSISTSDIACYLYDGAKNYYINTFVASSPEGSAEDIIGAIFGSTVIRIGNTTLKLNNAHTTQYYQEGDYDLPMKEIMANTNVLIVQNSPLINQLREIIGDELFDYITQQRQNGREKSNRTITNNEKGISA